MSTIAVDREIELIARLGLDRPLAVFDLETTGKYPERDRIVEITIVKLYPSLNGADAKVSRFTSFINPGIPIPAEVTAIHGITDDQVKDAMSFAQLAPTLVRGFSGADLCGYNARRFDVPMLCAEFARAGVPFSIEGRRIVDPQVIFFKREPRDLEAALKFFCGIESHDGAHRAAADVDATIAVLASQLERYPDLVATVPDLHAFCSQREPHWIDEQGKLVWVDGEACIGFGKKAGQSLRALCAKEPDYLGWVLRSDFPKDVKDIVRDATRGKFPVKTAGL